MLLMRAKTETTKVTLRGTPSSEGANPTNQKEDLGRS